MRSLVVAGLAALVLAAAPRPRRRTSPSRSSVRRPSAARGRRPRCPTGPPAQDHRRPRRRLGGHRHRVRRHDRPLARRAVYTDHLFDAYGADDGRDAERLQRREPLDENVPETYRLEALQQQDPAGEFGAARPRPVPLLDELRRPRARGRRRPLRGAPRGRRDDAYCCSPARRRCAAPTDTALLVLLDDDAAATARARRSRSAAA